MARRRPGAPLPGPARPLLAQLSVDVLDEVVQLYDQAVSSTDHRAERKVEEQLVARAKASEDRLCLLDELLSVLTDPQVPDDAVGARLRKGSAWTG